MFNVLMACFRHETNTFSTQRTDYQAYKSLAYALGEEVIEKYKGTRSETGGFIARLEKENDINLIPVILAEARPSGPVTADFYEHVCDEMKKAVAQQQRIDGVLLSLHGAMVIENRLDGEGDFLEYVRGLVGPEVPIIATLDLHAIITEKKARNATVLINYDYYPHTDMFERGYEGADIILRTLRGEVKPTMSCKKLPLILPFVSSSHTVMKQYLDMAHEYEKDSRVLTVSISYGFPYGDVPELGTAVVAVTDGDGAYAEKIAERIANGLWEQRKELKKTYYDLEDAISIINGSDEGPFVVPDVTDNPGGGASCDATVILQAMLNRGVKNAIVAQICDPESLQLCYEAGIGNSVELRLGGKLGPASAGAPIECTAYVKRLTDGTYTNRDYINGGYPVTLGKTALIVVDDIEIILTGCTEQPFDTEMLYSHGIDPRKKHCILLKSAVHYKAAYEPIAHRILPIHIDGGMLQEDISKIPYKHITRPIYPLDEL